MRNLLGFAVLVFSFFFSFSQQPKTLARNYPSLLWEITGKGLSKPSYLFGTMHVSSKMVFHLSDSFYLGIKNADVVALETNMGTWQDDFSRYDLAGFNYDYYLRQNYDGPSDYFTIGTLQVPAYEKLIELALYSSPSMINSFLYRTNSDKAVDFEEDTYLDMHIFQAAKKWNKKVCGVENFDRSMELMKEAYADALKEKNKKERTNDYDGDFSYSKLEDAYRTGNLDLLDTINKVNSTSAAFDEKFLYKRNEIQASSIDSILKTKQALFVGVGAAHLPGQRGVIELLRRQGYKLRPIKITERDSRHKEELEKIRVPVQFAKQTSADGFFSVSVPGRFYNFGNSFGLIDQQQYADMSNGAYYMVTRINTNSLLWGDTEDKVLRKIDSVIYENVPGKILSKQPITKNGYKGFEVTNRTRRGDFQRYNIFVTPFEVILFKMSGNEDYVRDGTEASQFFGSIQFRDYQNEWKKWSPSFGGFEVEFPHEPVVVKKTNWQFMALDKATNTGFDVIRTDVHNYSFVEEDSFDLDLMEESFASSDFIDKQISRKQTKWDGYSALDAKYKCKDGSVALVRFLIQGTHYYTIVARGKSENAAMNQFLNSFTVTPFQYDTARQLADTSLHFTVKSPVLLDKPKKLTMYPENFSRYGSTTGDDDSDLSEENTYKNKMVTNDSTGEKIFVSFIKPSRYYYSSDSTSVLDSSWFEKGKMRWQFRSKRKYELPNKTKVYEYVISDPKSSRYIQNKVFVKDGVSFWLQTEGDTISKPSAFVTNFFESFTPADTIKGVNPKEKKTKLFFQDFFSSDTIMHRKAVVNVSKLDFDSTDFDQLKKCVEALSWKEKKYMDVKNDFIAQLSVVRSKQSADYLKNVYFAAGDTVDFQYAALSALLHQQTAYAFGVFRDIMVSEPPILDIDNGNSSTYTARRAVNNYSAYKYLLNRYRYNNDDNSRGQDFLDGLSDSLQLTATIFKDLLPLINIHDYEQNIMQLTGTLIDSSLITAKDYETYENQFLIEAKQLLKKQMIIEKNKSIAKAQKDDQDNTNDNSATIDDGNSELNLYATLLMPFWDKSPTVQQFITQLLNSSDKRLKYTTSMLLLRNHKSLPDSMLRYFAAMDDYRYELYSDLKENKLSGFFPAGYNSQVELARSKLFRASGDYNKPDTLVYLNKLPVVFKERSGFVFFFKYKTSKDDNAWKIASTGIIPNDTKQFEFDDSKLRYWQEQQFDFTELSGTKLDNETSISSQLKKALRKMLYSKRNSAAQFYEEQDRTRPEYNLDE